MSSIASQLAMAVGTAPLRQQNVSLLFDQQQANDTDTATIFNLARNGLTELITEFSIFSHFSTTLFKEIPPFNVDINDYKQEIKAFLYLTAPLILRKEVHKCIEFLIRAFHIHLHKFSIKLLLTAMLPYSATALFPKFINLCNFSNIPTLSFFTRVRTTKSAVPRSTIALAAMKDIDLLEFLLTHSYKYASIDQVHAQLRKVGITSVSTPHTTTASSNVLASFVTLFMIDLLAIHDVNRSSPNNLQLKLILSHISRCLVPRNNDETDKKGKKVKATNISTTPSSGLNTGHLSTSNLCIGAYMILTNLCYLVKLDYAILTAMISQLLISVPHDSPPQIIIYPLMCLISLLESQRGVLLDKSFTASSKKTQNGRESYIVMLPLDILRQLVRLTHLREAISILNNNQGYDVSQTVAAIVVGLAKYLVLPAGSDAAATDQGGDAKSAGSSQAFVINLPFFELLLSLCENATHTNIIQPTAITAVVATTLNCFARATSVGKNAGLQPSTVKQKQPTLSLTPALVKYLHLFFNTMNYHHSDALQQSVTAILLVLQNHPKKPKGSAPTRQFSTLTSTSTDSMNDIDSPNDIVQAEQSDKSGFFLQFLNKTSFEALTTVLSSGLQCTKHQLISDGVTATALTITQALSVQQTDPAVKLSALERLNEVLLELQDDLLMYHRAKNLIVAGPGKTNAIGIGTVTKDGVATSNTAISNTDTTAPLTDLESELAFLDGGLFGDAPAAPQPTPSGSKTEDSGKKSLHPTTSTASPSTSPTETTSTVTSYAQDKFNNVISKMPLNLIERHIRQSQFTFDDSVRLLLVTLLQETDPSVIISIINMGFWKRILINFLENFTSEMTNVYLNRILDAFCLVLDRTLSIFGLETTTDQITPFITALQYAHWLQGIEFNNDSLHHQDFAKRGDASTALTTQTNDTTFSAFSTQSSHKFTGANGTKKGGKKENKVEVKIVTKNDAALHQLAFMRKTTENTLFSTLEAILPLICIVHHQYPTKKGAKGAMEPQTLKIMPYFTLLLTIPQQSTITTILDGYQKQDTSVAVASEKKKSKSAQNVQNTEAAPVTSIVIRSLQLQHLRLFMVLKSVEMYNLVIDCCQFLANTLTTGTESKYFSITHVSDSNANIQTETQNAEIDEPTPKASKKSKKQAPTTTTTSVVSSPSSSSLFTTPEALGQGSAAAPNLIVLGSNEVYFFGQLGKICSKMLKTVSEISSQCQTMSQLISPFANKHAPASATVVNVDKLLGKKDADGVVYLPVETANSLSDHLVSYQEVTKAFNLQLLATNITDSISVATCGGVLGSDGTHLLADLMNLVKKPFNYPVTTQSSLFTDESPYRGLTSVSYLMLVVAQNLIAQSNPANASLNVPKGDSDTFSGLKLTHLMCDSSDDESSQGSTASGQSGSKAVLSMASVVDLTTSAVAFTRTLVSNHYTITTKHEIDNIYAILSRLIGDALEVLPNPYKTSQSGVKSSKNGQNAQKSIEKIPYGTWASAVSDAAMAALLSEQLPNGDNLDLEMGQNGQNATKVVKNEENRAPFDYAYTHAYLIATLYLLCVSSRQTAFLPLISEKYNIQVDRLEEDNVEVKEQKSKKNKNAPIDDKAEQKTSLRVVTETVSKSGIFDHIPQITAVPTPSVEAPPTPRRSARLGANPSTSDSKRSKSFNFGATSSSTPLAISLTPIKNEVRIPTALLLPLIAFPVQFLGQNDQNGQNLQHTSTHYTPPHFTFTTSIPSSVNAYQRSLDWAIAAVHLLAVEIKTKLGKATKNCFFDALDLDVAILSIFSLLFNPLTPQPLAAVIQKAVFSVFVNAVKKNEEIYPKNGQKDETSSQIQNLRDLVDFLSLFKPLLTPDASPVLTDSSSDSMQTGAVIKASKRVNLFVNFVDFDAFSGSQLAVFLVFSQKLLPALALTHNTYAAIGDNIINVDGNVAHVFKALGGSGNVPQVEEAAPVTKTKSGKKTQKSESAEKMDKLENFVQTAQNEANLERYSNFHSDVSSTPLSSSIINIMVGVTYFLGDLILAWTQIQQAQKQCKNPIVLDSITAQFITLTQFVSALQPIAPLMTYIGNASAVTGTQICPNDQSAVLLTTEPPKISKISYPQPLLSHRSQAMVYELVTGPIHMVFDQFVSVLAKFSETMTQNYQKAPSSSNSTQKVSFEVQLVTFLLTLLKSPLTLPSQSWFYYDSAVQNQVVLKSGRVLAIFKENPELFVEIGQNGDKKSSSSLTKSQNNATNYQYLLFDTLIGSLGQKDALTGKNKNSSTHSTTSGSNSTSMGMGMHAVSTETVSSANQYETAILRFIQKHQVAVNTANSLIVSQNSYDYNNVDGVGNNTNNNKAKAGTKKVQSAQKMYDFALSNAVLQFYSWAPSTTPLVTNLLFNYTLSANLFASHLSRFDTKLHTMLAMTQIPETAALVAQKDSVPETETETETDAKKASKKSAKKSTQNGQNATLFNIPFSDFAQVSSYHEYQSLLSLLSASLQHQYACNTMTVSKTDKNVQNSQKSAKSSKVSARSLSVAHSLSLKKRVVIQSPWALMEQLSLSLDSVSAMLTAMVQDYTLTVASQNDHIARQLHDARANRAKTALGIQIDSTSVHDHQLNNRLDNEHDQSHLNGHTDYYDFMKEQSLLIDMQAKIAQKFSKISKMYEIQHQIVEIIYYIVITTQLRVTTGESGWPTVDKYVSPQIMALLVSIFIKSVKTPQVNDIVSMVKTNHKYDSSYNANSDDSGAAQRRKGQISSMAGLFLDEEETKRGFAHGFAQKKKTKRPDINATWAIGITKETLGDRFDTLGRGDEEGDEESESQQQGKQNFGLQDDFGLPWSPGTALHQFNDSQQQQLSLLHTNTYRLMSRDIILQTVSVVVDFAISTKLGQNKTDETQDSQSQISALLQPLYVNLGDIVHCLVGEMGYLDYIGRVNNLTNGTTTQLVNYSAPLHNYLEDNQLVGYAVKAGHYTAVGLGNVVHNSSLEYFLKFIRSIAVPLVLLRIKLSLATEIDQDYQQYLIKNGSSRDFVGAHAPIGILSHSSLLNVIYSYSQWLNNDVMLLISLSTLYYSSETYIKLYIENTTPLQSRQKYQNQLRTTSLLESTSMGDDSDAEVDVDNADADADLDSDGDMGDEEEKDQLDDFEAQLIAQIAQREASIRNGNGNLVTKALTVNLIAFAEPLDVTVKKQNELHGGLIPDLVASAIITALSTASSSIEMGYYHQQWQNEANAGAAGKGKLGSKLRNLVDLKQEQSTHILTTLSSSLIKLIAPTQQTQVLAMFKHFLFVLPMFAQGAERVEGTLTTFIKTQFESQLDDGETSPELDTLIQKWDSVIEDDAAVQKEMALAESDKNYKPSGDNWNSLGPIQQLLVQTKGHFEETDHFKFQYKFGETESQDANSLISLEPKVSRKKFVGGVGGATMQFVSSKVSAPKASTRQKLEEQVSRRVATFIGGDNQDPEGYIVQLDQSGLYQGTKLHSNLPIGFTAAMVNILGQQRHILDLKFFKKSQNLTESAAAPTAMNLVNVGTVLLQYGLFNFVVAFAESKLFTRPLNEASLYLDERYRLTDNSKNIFANKSVDQDLMDDCLELVQSYQDTVTAFLHISIQFSQISAQVAKILKTQRLNSSYFNPLVLSATGIVHSHLDQLQSTSNTLLSTILVKQLTTLGFTTLFKNIFTHLALLGQGPSSNGDLDQNGTKAGHKLPFYAIFHQNPLELNFVALPSQISDIMQGDHFASPQGPSLTFQGQNKTVKAPVVARKNSKTAAGKKSKEVEAEVSPVTPYFTNFSQTSFPTTPAPNSHYTSLSPHLTITKDFTTLHTTHVCSLTDIFHKLITIFISRLAFEREILFAESFLILLGNHPNLSQKSSHYLRAQAILSSELSEDYSSRQFEQYYDVGQGHQFGSYDEDSTVDDFELSSYHLDAEMNIGLSDPSKALKGSKMGAISGEDGTTISEDQYNEQMYGLLHAKRKKFTSSHAAARRAKWLLILSARRRALLSMIPWIVNTIVLPSIPTPLVQKLIPVLSHTSKWPVPSTAISNSLKFGSNNFNLVGEGAIGASKAKSPLSLEHLQVAILSLDELVALTFALYFPLDDPQKTLRLLVFNHDLYKTGSMNRNATMKDQMSIVPKESMSIILCTTNVLFLTMQYASAQAFYTFPTDGSVSADSSSSGALVTSTGAIKKAKLNSKSAQTQAQVAKMSQLVAQAGSGDALQNWVIPAPQTAAEQRSWVAVLCSALMCTSTMLQRLQSTALTLVNQVSSFDVALLLKSISLLHQYSVKNDVGVKITTSTAVSHYSGSGDAQMGPHGNLLNILSPEYVSMVQLSSLSLLHTMLIIYGNMLEPYHLPIAFILCHPGTVIVQSSEEEEADLAAGNGDASRLNILRYSKSESSLRAAGLSLPASTSSSSHNDEEFVSLVNNAGSDGKTKGPDQFVTHSTSAILQTCLTTFAVTTNPTQLLPLLLNIHTITVALGPIAVTRLVAITHHLLNKLGAVYHHVKDRRYEIIQGTIRSSNVLAASTEGETLGGEENDLWDEEQLDILEEAATAGYNLDECYPSLLQLLLLVLDIRTDKGGLELRNDEEAYTPEGVALGDDHDEDDENDQEGSFMNQMVWSDDDEDSEGKASDRGIQPDDDSDFDPEFHASKSEKLMLDNDDDEDEDDDDDEDDEDNDGEDDSAKNNEILNEHQAIAARIKNAGQFIDTTCGQLIGADLKFFTKSWIVSIETVLLTTTSFDTRQQSSYHFQWSPYELGLLEQDALQVFNDLVLLLDHPQLALLMSSLEEWVGVLPYINNTSAVTAQQTAMGHKSLLTNYNAYDDVVEESRQKHILHLQGQIHARLPRFLIFTQICHVLLHSIRHIFIPFLLDHFGGFMIAALTPLDSETQKEFILRKKSQQDNKCFKLASLALNLADARRDNLITQSDPGSDDAHDMDDDEDEVEYKLDSKGKRKAVSKSKGKKKKAEVQQEIVEISAVTGSNILLHTTWYAHSIAVIIDILRVMFLIDLSYVQTSTVGQSQYGSASINASVVDRAARASKRADSRKTAIGDNIMNQVHSDRRDAHDLKNAAFQRESTNDLVIKSIFRELLPKTFVEQIVVLLVAQLQHGHKLRHFLPTTVLPQTIEAMLEQQAKITNDPDDEEQQSTYILQRQQRYLMLPLPSIKSDIIRDIPALPYTLVSPGGLHKAIANTSRRNLLQYSVYVEQLLIPTITTVCEYLHSTQPLLWENVVTLLSSGSSSKYLQIRFASLSTFLSLLQPQSCIQALITSRGGIKAGTVADDIVGAEDPSQPNRPQRGRNGAIKIDPPQWSNEFFHACIGLFAPSIAEMLQDSSIHVQRLAQNVFRLTEAISGESFSKYLNGSV